MRATLHCAPQPQKIGALHQSGVSRALRRRREAARDEIVAVAPQARVRIVDPRCEDDDRGLELAVDLRVALVLEAKAEAAVGGNVRELPEHLPLHRRGERDSEPALVDRIRGRRLRGGEGQRERRRREEPVAAARLAVARDTDERTLTGRPHEPPRVARVGRKQCPEAGAARHEAGGLPRDRRPAAEEVDIREPSAAADGRRHVHAVPRADQAKARVLPAARAPLDLEHAGPLRLRRLDGERLVRSVGRVERRQQTQGEPVLARGRGHPREQARRIELDSVALVLDDEVAHSTVTSASACCPNGTSPTVTSAATRARSTGETAGATVNTAIASPPSSTSTSSTSGVAAHPSGSDEPDAQRLGPVERVPHGHLQPHGLAGANGGAVRLDPRGEPLGAQVDLVDREQLAMQLGEAAAVGEQHVEPGVVHLADGPVPAQDQVGAELAVELGAADVVVVPEPVAVLVVEDRPVGLVRLLISRREDATAVHLERDRRGVQRVPGQRIGAEFVLVPGERLVERQPSVDADRVVPEAGKVVAGGVLEHVGEVLRHPDRGPLYLAQEVDPGDVVVVVVRRQHDFDALRPRVAPEREDRVQEGSPRGPGGRHGVPCPEVVAKVEDERGAGLGDERVAVRHRSPVAEEVRGDLLPRVAQAHLQIPGDAAAHAHQLVQPPLRQLDRSRRVGDRRAV